MNLADLGDKEETEWIEKYESIVVPFCKTTFYKI